MLYPIENRIREVKNLSGIWNFKIDYDNVGIEEKWYKSPLKDTVLMAVPASYNDLFTDEKAKEHVGLVWYETEFYIPDSWMDKRVVLRFGSATHHATVWVNGIQVAKHKGGFLPFEADITDVVKDNSDKFRLTVCLSNILDWTCLPCGEIIKKDSDEYPDNYHFQETYFDFYNYSGIHRPVKLYTTPIKYIKDIFIDTDLNGDFSIAKVNVKVLTSDRLKKISVLDEAGNVVVETDSFQTMENEYKDTLCIDNPHLWNPGKAYLYQLKVESENDVYTESFGIRSIKVTNKSFLINNKEFYFKGFGRHEDSEIHGKGLDNALNIKDFNLLKWLGANSFRTSHYPYSEEHMMMADREGFVVIDEVPAVGMCFWDGKSVFSGDRVNDETLKHHLDCLEEMYKRDKNHPSIVMWSVANEAATHEEGAVPYFKTVIDKMRSLDNKRPITMVHTTTAEGDKVSQWLDMIMVNRYYAWYNDHSHLEVIGLQLEKEMRAWHDKYNKPIILSEYGADTIAGYHKLPAVAFTEEFQCKYLDEYHKIFDKLDFMIGEHVWAYADFQTKQGLNRVDGNKKGVFTRNRQPKMAAYLLKERWSKK